MKLRSRVLGQGLTVTAAAWIVVAFFLPWVHFELRNPALASALTSQSEVGAALGQLIGNTGRVTIAIEQPKGLVATDLAALATLPPQLSGAQIPPFLREERMQVLLALADIWQGRQQPWTQRSYAVYAVPGLAVLAALLLLWGGARPPVARAIAGVLALVAAVAAGWWWLRDWATPVVIVTLGVGLWSSWWAYWVMAWGAFLCARQPRAKTA